MSAYVICVGCGTPLYGFSPCQWCTCERCGSDLRDGFCSLCNSRNSCVYDPNSNSFDCPPNSYHPPHPTYETYSGDSCGNDFNFGYDCPPRFSLIYESEPGYIENYNSYPYDSSCLPQQYPCCTRCGSPHETCQCDQLIFDKPPCKNYEGPHMNFQCQPMNQNFYNSNSSGFDQSQPLQYPVNHQPRQEISTKMLLAKEKLIKAVRTCLKNNNQPPEEKIIAILLAEESIITVIQTLEEKQIDTESMQELLLQLFKDLQTLGNTSNQLNQEEQNSSQYWKPPVYYSDDNDDFYRENIDETPPSDAIAPDLPITDSLVMDNEDLDTISETDSDEEVESSVKNLNLTPSESKDLFDYVSECDLPFRDNSPDFNNDYEIFSYPLFDSKDDYTSSDDESSSEEDVLVNIHLIKKLLYDNSSPRPPEELNSKNDFEKENSGSTTIHTDISLPEYESFYDKSDSASEIFNDDLAHIISVPNVLITLPTIYPVFDTLLPLSSENKDKDSPDDEDSRARSFVQCSLGLHPLACYFGNHISLILLTNV
uniref:Pre-mRNA splicing Prp18-interacting factor n=1 Tax=Tanacetum cinerariifolium TaxID=118510 RepID=A0A6L2PAG0_TANCI|nr:pre-mRNA splicing Prp18-interacting factor [Tanacetum cinerariifolium]